MLAALLACGCARRRAGGVLPATGGTARTLGAATVPTAADAEWVVPAKDWSSTRFSALADLSVQTAPRLRESWSFSTGVLRGHEAAPLVVGSTMFVVTPYPNLLHALDLGKTGAPLRWTYEPEVDPSSQGMTGFDVVNRGASWGEGFVVFATLDGLVIAVNAETGQPVWKQRIADLRLGETITMAPTIVRGKVIVGNSGSEMGVRGFVAALDLWTGNTLWKAYSTGPDSDCRIGPRFKPFYASERGSDLGVTSWPADAWKVGGGAVSGWISYDPELDDVFYGTGNPAPWNPELRPGDDKWTSTIFARDLQTGDAIWAVPTSPHDLHAYDGGNELILANLPIGGVVRKVLMRADRNGFLYVIDRTSGEILSAKPFVHVTSASGVDLRTGRPIPAEEKVPAGGIVAREVCPGAAGGKGFAPMAFSPRTGLLYIPANNLCMDQESIPASYLAGTPFVGARLRMFAGPGGKRGELMAWDPIAGRKVWAIPESFPVSGGVLVTGGDLVFYGTMDGWFKAVDARSGRPLWQAKTPSGIVGSPMTYRGPDGKQYVAVMSGVGGWAGAIVSGDLDPRDATAAFGMAGAMSDLPKVTRKGGTVHAYALP